MLYDYFYYSALYAAIASTSSTADTNCAAIICDSGCEKFSFPRNYTTYDTLQDAMNQVSGRCGRENVYKLILKPGLEYSSVTMVPAGVYNLSISTFDTLGALRASIGPLILEGAEDSVLSSFSLSLASVIWNPIASNLSCLTLPNSMATNTSIAFSDILLHCQLSNLTLLSATLDKVQASCIDQKSLFGLDTSFFDMNNQVLSAESNCFEWNLRTAESASLMISQSSIQSNVYLSTLGSTAVNVSFSTLDGDWNIAVNGLGSHINLWNSSFFNTLIINASSLVDGSTIDRTTDKDDTHILIRSSVFRRAVSVIGPYLDLDVRYNIFSTNEVPGVLPSCNLWLDASEAAVGTLAYNDFLNGTTFLNLPAITVKAAKNCDKIFNSFAKLSIRANRFPAYSLNASMSVFFDPDCKIPSEHFNKLVIDATHNWWGHAGGPKLCCNPNGEGGFTSQFVRPDHWCLDPECSKFEKDTLSSQCVARCCSPVFNMTRRVLLATFAVVTYLILIVGVVIVTVIVRRNYGPTAFERSNRSDLIHKLSPILSASLAVSSFASIGVIGFSILLASPFWLDPALPRQATVQINSLVAASIFSFDSVFQLVKNVCLALALWKRSKWPRLLNWMSSKIFVLNCINVVYICVWGVIWISYASTMPPTCYASKTYFYAFNIGFGKIVKFDSSLSQLYAIGIIPIALYSIIIMIPHNALNQVLYHFEYACINTAVEVTLGEDLAKSPKLAKKGKVLRWVAVLPLALTLAIVGMCLHCIIQSPQIPLQAIYNPANELVWGFSRFANTLGCASAGVAVTGLTIYVSFSYNRPTLITTLTYTSIVIGIGIMDFNFAELIAAFALPPSERAKAFVLHGSFQAVGGLAVISLFIMAVLLYRFGHDVVSTIPTVARNNLNQHLDRAWGSHNSADFISTYLTEDPQMPLLTSDREY